ncbi:MULTISPECIES: secondary thiamine-phosphate synthase enzyme YjbQ [unclassified Methylophaga]|jgi:secondary thiamine-phosphate synthase enzyme|uniref:secondary thiamine-phosphate synthase enzyme YjbQ n=1 Tax=unclassified Methylophaga TaxID=2629249 RepID=UPI000C6B1522|nr:MULTISPECIES: secondary thiamine-phosphate synthase enzyme YjbQ [unclassified Methylophaga]HBQ59139.1 secondary thiamine-phosphate synthase [Balneolaceae bacterium]MAL48151.1 secondary thiamine-phosphate synthase [Methylophaga sp.]MAP25566.1 secondary thiamine-phosphate synthase [Methylophaga sp.]MBP25743.1 secondary thiamine-phosphate synthase [Methylophaga sp.]HAD32852.1 secondary thiamine-phosphate synthase [Methylophaga sp.]|tara:strand:- start:9104 stop:9520 length:417 start_codon:yes stop_codon:yes gene_type:complete
MILQQQLQFELKGRSTINITDDVAKIVSASGITTGTCHVFVQHTSASLMICENADPDVRRDLETYMQHIVPDGDPMFLHQDEGPDDMSAHIRTVLTNPDLVVPVSNGKCALGIWQGIYLWEHRTHRQQRRVIVTVQGE